MATYAPPPTYPHRDLGIALLIVGIIALVGGIAAAAYCSVSFLGLCLDYPYAGVGALSAVAGIALLILGVVLMVMRATPPAPVVQPVYFAPPAPAGGVVYYPVPATLPPSPPAAPPRPPVSPAGASTSAAPRVVAAAHQPRTFSRKCPACGAMNVTFDPAKTAFCQKCGKPFPPSPSSSRSPSGSRR